MFTFNLKIMFTSIIKRIRKKAALEPGMITLLYGGQSGNSAFIAEKAKKYLEKRDLAVRAVNMSRYPLEQLKDESHLLVVVSTHGEGDPPDAARKFHKHLLSGEAPQLGKLKYAVCAMGDSSYEHFCKVGKEVDARLNELGASRLMQRTDCDVEFQRPAAKWLEGVLSAYQKNGKEKTIDIELDDQPESGVEATVKERYALNEGQEEETFHIALSMTAADFPYRPGDSVSLVPENHEEIVNKLIHLLKADGNTQVVFNEKQLPLYDVLKYQVELTRLSKKLLGRYQKLTGNLELGQLLDDQQALFSYLDKRNVNDLLEDFPASVSAEALITILQKLQVRFYSIASSKLQTPGELHLIVRMIGPSVLGNERYGTCSSFLGSQLNVGDRVRMQLIPNEGFHLPQGSTPVIMISAGTGIAPFRAFLQEWEAQKEQPENWLIFGEKHRQHNFYYRDEWGEWLGKGTLKRMDLAFSRDQDEKFYVQHQVLQQGEEFQNWLNRGAHIYLCGGLAMGREVEQAIRKVMMNAGSLSETEAKTALEQLKEEGRWHTDLY